MNESSPDEQAHQLLEGDRIWCAYALADLYPPHRKYANWHLSQNAVLLLYTGLKPPILFAHGDPKEVELLFDQVPAGHYQYSLIGSHFARICNKMRLKTKIRMWRMRLHRARFPGLSGAEKVSRLSRSNLSDIYALFAEHPDRPDAFHERQLDDGIAYGIRREGALVCFAGLHVLSRKASVAAIGNVFTHPQHRGQGLATKASSAVVQSLIERSIKTIVLNVSVKNEAAIHCYRGLGFMPYCGYYEGVAEILSNHTERRWTEP